APFKKSPVKTATPKPDPQSKQPAVAKPRRSTQSY
ncbi:MAG: ribonuclease HI, partial [Mesorhizobium sp.]